MSSLIFPWFSGPCPQVARIPLLPELEKLLAFYYQSGFATVYGHILRTIVNNEISVIAESLEPILLSKLETDLNFVKQRNMQLKIINEGAPITVTFSNAKQNIGVSINRTESQIFEYKVTKGKFDKYVRKEDAQIFIPSAVSTKNTPDIKKLSSIIKSEILRVDCLISSPMKLLLLSDNNEVLQGRRDDTPEEHLLQFEAMLCSDKNAWVFSIPKALKVEELEWVLTDVDRRLNENPYRVAK